MQILMSQRSFFAIHQPWIWGWGVGCNPGGKRPMSGQLAKPSGTEGEARAICPTGWPLTGAGHVCPHFTIFQFGSKDGDVYEFSRSVGGTAMALFGTPV